MTRYSVDTAFRRVRLPRAALDTEDDLVSLDRRIHGAVENRVYVPALVYLYPIARARLSGFLRVNESRDFFRSHHIVSPLYSICGKIPKC